MTASALLGWLRRNAFFIAVCAAIIVPPLGVRYPAMQDFPVHLATLRVLSELHDTRSGFDADFEATLGQTQYVGFYGVGGLLSVLVGARGAVLALVALYLVGTLVALRLLLRSLRRDERLAYVAVPMLTGPLLGLGLLPFLVGFPFLIAGIALLVVRWRQAATSQAGRTLVHVAVATIGIALFYLHVLHVGIFFFAALILFPFRMRGRQRIAAAASLVPLLALVVRWVTTTNVGRHVIEIGANWGATNRPPLLLALADIVPWLTDAFPDSTDEMILAVTLLTLGVATWRAFRTADDDPLSPKRYALIPLLCVVLFFTGERSRGVVWPLAPRYILPAALLAIPLIALPRDERARRRIVGTLGALSLVSIVNTARHYVAFDQEASDFTPALAAMEPRRRVAALVYGVHSRHARFAPFLHFGSYYQAEKGGVVDFTFAGYDQWPFTFKRGRYPLYDGPATPRWEMYAEDIASQQPLATYFDYVLTRDRGDTPIPPGFVTKWQGPHWEVLERAHPSTGAY